jgi:hypothetical protein
MSELYSKREVRFIHVADTPDTSHTKLTVEGIMFTTKRIAAVTTAAAISLGSLGTPVMAATSTHWTKAQCQSWEKSFAKRNPKASSKRKAQGNKVLKGKGCKVTIK